MTLIRLAQLVVAAAVMVPLVQRPLPRAFAEGSGDGSGVSALDGDADLIGDIGVTAPPLTVPDPFVRQLHVAPSEPIVVAGFALERVERGAELTRVGRNVTAISAGLLAATAIAAAASGVDCYDESDNCAGYGAAMAGVGLSAAGLMGGTITWSSGTLIAANGLRRAGVPVSNGAGIAAVALAALYFPGAWVASPIQNYMNRNAWDRWVAPQGPRAQLSVVPTLVAGRWGAALSVRF